MVERFSYRLRYADVEPVIECNADMMKQVFLYLILNALHGRRPP